VELLLSLILKINLDVSHDLDKLMVVQLAVAVQIGGVHELLDLFVGQALPEGCRHDLQLLGIDEPVLVLVKHLERHPQFLKEVECEEKRKLKLNIKKLLLHIFLEAIL